MQNFLSSIAAVEQFSTMLLYRRQYTKKSKSWLSAPERFLPRLSNAHWLDWELASLVGVKVLAFQMPVIPISSMKKLLYAFSVLAKVSHESTVTRVEQ